MANYDAQINIIVGGQRNLQNLTGQLNEIESTIEQIDRRWRAATAALQRARIRLNVAGTTQPRGEGGRFARDPDRQARFAAYADRRRASVESLLSRRAIARTRAEATATRDLIGQNERLISQTERRIALESRLNSANDLFQRRLQQLSRGGGGRNLTEELRAQVQSIQNAYSAAGGGASRNLRLVQSLATELGRVVERQNEFNRLRALSSKGFEAGRRLQERIDAIASTTRSGRVRTARGLATEAIAASYRGDQQAYSEAIRRATAFTSRLERESKQNADNIKQAERTTSNIVALDQQRLRSLQEIARVEERIRSGARISRGQAEDYYFQAGLTQRALPFGDVSKRAIRGGARTTGPSSIGGVQVDRVREFLGGARTADEANAALRLSSAVDKSRASVRGISDDFRKIFLSQLPAGTQALAVFEKIAKNLPGIIKKSGQEFSKYVDANERASASAVALNRQREAALAKILLIEEKIRSSQRIGAEEARDYYFQTGISRKALPFGSIDLPSVRGGARSSGPSIIGGQPVSRIRELLGGGRTEQEALATLRLAAADRNLAQPAFAGVDAEYNRFLPDTKILNATGRGIERLKTNQNQFNEAVASGARFQKKQNQELERLRKIYGDFATISPTGEVVVSMPAGTGAPSSRKAGSNKLVGFSKTFADLTESLQLSRDYFGDSNPAEAIDQIVRAFGGGDSGSALKSQGSDVADNVSSTFASSIKKGAGRMTSAAKSVFNQVTQAINDAFGIASPSRFIIDLVRNLASTYIAEMRRVGTRVKSVTRSTFDPKGFALSQLPLVQTGSVSGVAERLAGFVGRATTKPSAFRPLLRASGEAILSSGAVTEATYRKAYEKGGIISPGLLPAGERRGLRGTAGLPGSGLESAIRELAAKVAAASGSFVGPLAGPKRALAGISSSYMPSILQSGYTGYSGSATSPLFSAASLGAVAGTGSYSLGYTPQRGGASSNIQAPYASFLALSRDADKYKQKLPAALESIVNGSRDFGDTLFRLGEKIGQAGDRLIVSSAAERRGTPLPTRPAQIASAAAQSLSPYASSFREFSQRAEQISSAVADQASSEAERSIRDVFGDLVSGVQNFGRRVRSSVSGGGGGAIPPSGVGGSGAPGDPEDFARRVSQATTAEALLGLDELRNVRQLSSRELQLLSAAIEEVQQNLRPATADFDRFNNEITQLRGRIGIEQGARNPDADFFARRRIGPRTGRALSEGLVGGAFPLLFGQGLGASVFGGLGGAAGGFAGGGLGFGLSLVGTALGTAFDTTVAAASELGGALNDLSTTFEVVKNRALFSSRETEKLASKLEEAGLVASASILAQEEVIRKIGTSGVRDLKNLETASDRLSRAWAEFTLQLQVALAGPMAGLLDWVTQIVLTLGTFKNQDEFAREVGAGLSGRDKEEFDRRYAEIERLSRESILKGGLTPGQASDQKLLLARDFFTRSKISGAIKTDADLALESQLTGAETFVNALNAKLSALDLGKSLIDQVKNATQEQEDLDRQRAKAVEDYERAIGDIRLGVERRVTQERLNNLAKENEIYSKQGDIRLQQLKNENAIARESLRGNDLGQQLFDIVAQYSEEQLATENEIANRRRSLEAELQSVAIETEQYKVDVAKQVADLNRSTAEQVQQIQLSTARKQDQSARNRFELEKQIAIAQIKVQEFSAKQEARKLETLIKAEKDTGVKADLQASLDIYKGFFEGGGANPFTVLENQVKGLKPPAQLSYAGFNVGQGVSTAGFDAVIAAGNQLRLRLEELSKALDSLVAAGKFNEFNSQLMNLADQGVTEAAKEFKELSASLELITGGSAGLGALLPQFEALDEAQKKILGSEAVQKSPQKAELEKLIPLYIRLAKVNMQAAETYGFFNSAISENLNEVTSLKEEINNLLAGTTAYEQALASLTARGLGPASEEARKLLASAQELDRLRDKAEILNNIRDAATGFSDSLRGLVEQFVELKDAGEAVKAFSEELGKKSLSFVLDLAFKPIEDAMQKQFIAFADMLGVDVRPEELKQLTELQKIENWARQINDAIKPIADSLVAMQKQAEAEALAKAQQQQTLPASAASSEFLNSEGHQKYFSTISRYAKLQLSGYYDEASVKTQAAMYEREQRNAIYADPRYTQEQKDAIYARVISLLEEQEKLRLEAIRKMTGQGGPDTAIPGIDVPLADRDLPSPDALKPLTEGMTGAVQKLPDTINKTTEGVNKSTQGLQTANAAWLKGLGQAVTGLAGAAAGIVGITGGVQQMSGGGAYNTLTGLAGIFGGIASVTSMFGTGGAFAGAFGGGAPGGSIAPGPVAQSAGVTYSPGYYGPAFKAAGGPVLGGSPYVVGEQGPELFIPSGNGMIIPNRSSKVERSNNPFAATSQQVSVNGERAMTANIDNSPIKVESRIINGVEYVTMDQLNEATRRAEVRGAERGKSLAISSLQNSVKTRKRVGV